MWIFGVNSDPESEWLSQIGREEACWSSLLQTSMEPRPRFAVCCPVSLDSGQVVSSKVLKSHILISSDLSDQEFTSCNGEAVSMEGNDLLVLRTDTAGERKARILNVREGVHLSSF